VVKKRFAAQIAIYMLGLFILAFGVVFAINSDLGISPVNALPFVVSLVSGIQVGICVTVFLLACIGLQIILLRRGFKWINLTQIFFSFIFGYFVDLAMFIKGDFSLAHVVGNFGIPAYVGQLLMLAISIALLAIGVALYLEAKLISLPPEGVVQAIASKLRNGKFHRVKIAMDSILVLMALAVTLIFMGGVYGLREGTVFSAIFIGKMIPVAQKFITPILEKIGFRAIGSTEQLPTE